MARVEQTQIQFEVEINGNKKVLNTLKEVRAQRRVLIKQLETQTLTQEQYNKKVAELAKLNGILSEHRKKMKGISDETKGATKGLASFGKVGQAVRASFGWVSLVLGALAGIIEMTRRVFNEQESLTAVNERINQLTSLQGEALLQATATAQALAKTYEVDVLNAVEAANAAARSFRKEGENLGVVYQEQLDAIALRLSVVGDNQQEFIDQVAEYANQAKLAGIEANTFYNIVAEGINRGIPTDKLIDSVKEFDIRIKTLTKGQKDTLEQTLGQQFTDTLVRNVETGATTSYEALQQVSEQMLVLGEESAQARLLMSDLFGGAGEDAALFAEIIATTTDNFEELTGATSVYSERKREINTLEKESAKALAELNFQLDGSSSFFAKVAIIVRTAFYQAIAAVAEVINNFSGYVGVAKEGFKAFINSAIDDVETLLRVALYPLLQAIELITGKELRLGRLDVDTEAYEKLQTKIQADREKFAADEQARRQAIADQEASDAARKRAALIQENTAKVEAEKEVENQKFEIRKLSETQSVIDSRSLNEQKINEELDAEKAKEAAKAEISRQGAEERAAIELEIERQKQETQKGLYEQFQRAAFGLAATLSERAFDSRIEKLEEEQERELALAGDNQKKRKAIEDKFEKEKERAEKARRTRQKLLEIAQAGINTAQSILKTGATLGYPAAIPFQIQAGIIGAIQTATIAAQKFAGGGLVSQLGPGKISVSPNVSPTADGDNVLAFVRTGEVILNERQQAMLGGPQTFARIGVPGFADGGAITTPSLQAVNTAAPSAEGAAILEQLTLLNEGMRRQKFVSVIGQKEAETISSLQDEMTVGQARRSF